jgi:DNA-binding response OmpR family regulator
MTENLNYSAHHEELDQREAAQVEPSLPNGHEDTDSGDWIKIGELALSPGLRKATYGGKELHLTSAEFNILEYLLRNRGTVLSREALVQAALGRHLGALDRSIDVHISRLRRKLIESGADDAHIKAVRGAGYIYTALPTNLQTQAA